MSYKWIVDPGHAWLEVPKSEVIASGAKISHYSYEDRKTGMAYLEEDCDAPAFLKKIGDGNANYIIFPSEYQQNTFVRNLPSFNS